MPYRGNVHSAAKWFWNIYSSNLQTWKKYSSHYVKVSTYYYYNRFTAPWTLSGTTHVSRYQKGKTRKVKPIWIYWSKRQWQWQ